MTVTLGGNTLVTLGNDASACLRVRFETSAQTLQTPGTAIITISNVTDAYANSLCSTKQYTPVTLSAGYAGNAGLIFSGKLVQARKWRENPLDTAVILGCADGQDAYKFGVVSASVAKGATPMDLVSTAMKAWAPYGITAGYLDQAALTKFSYPRGVAMFGMVHNYIRDIASWNQTSFSIQRGKLQMVSATGALPGSAVVLNASTGLIGTPEQTEQGVKFRMLINPAMLVDRVAQINQADINQGAIAIGTGGYASPTQILPSTAADGFYRVYSINCTGDTRGTPWYMDCVGIPVNYSGRLPEAAKQSPYLYPSSPIADHTKI